MEEWPRREFMFLQQYDWLLIASLEEKRIMPANQLTEIRAHLMRCDNLVGHSRFRKQMLLTTATHWEECLANWSLQPPAGEENLTIDSLHLKTGKIEISTAPTKIPDQPEKPDSKASWDLTNNDRRFLRSLKISANGETENPDK